MKCYLRAPGGLVEATKFRELNVYHVYRRSRSRDCRASAHHVSFILSIVLRLTHLTIELQYTNHLHRRRCTQYVACSLLAAIDLIS